MRLLNIFKRKEKVDIYDKLKLKDLYQRYCLFLFGTMLSAVTFNLFYEKYNIVTGGTTGLALVVKEYFSIATSDFVFISSIILLIISFIFLGKVQTFKTILGVLIYPMFIRLAMPITNIIDFGNTSMLVLMIYGGVLSGFATGIILKSDFSLGGLQVLSLIMNKYLKISYGTASLVVNSIVVVLGTLVFGISNAIYAIISLYISSIIVDKVLLGISNSKSFYIITNKEKEIKELIINNINHSFTLINSTGGYSNDSKKVLMCIIPTREYLFVKDVVTKIDPSAFFLITDAYEVSGGH